MLVNESIPCDRGGIIALRPLPPPKRILIWPSSSNHSPCTIVLPTRFVLGANLSLANVLFSCQPEINKLHETQSGAGVTACPVFYLSVYRLEIFGCLLKSILSRRHLFLERQGDSLFG